MTQAIERYEPGENGSMQAITGGHLDQFQQWSKAIAVGTIVPDALRGKPADVLITVLHGLDLGLKPMQAINAIYVVKGRPSLSAEGMRALLLSAGHAFRVVESTSEKAIVEGRRKGSEEWNRAEFTDEQRKKARLSGANWDAYPEDMLLARATTRLCKRFFSDVIGGLPGAEDVVDESAVQRPTLGQVVAARTAGNDTEPTMQPDEESTRAAVLEAEASFTGNGTTEQPDQPVDADPMVTKEQLAILHDGYTAIGITDKQERLDFAYSFIDRRIGSATELTEDEADRLIQVLRDHAGSDEGGQSS